MPKFLDRRVPTSWGIFPYYWAYINLLRFLTFKTLKLAESYLSERVVAREVAILSGWCVIFPNTPINSSVEDIEFRDGHCHSLV